MVTPSASDLDPGGLGGGRGLAWEGGAGWQEVTQAAGMSHSLLPSPV